MSQVIEHALSQRIVTSQVLTETILNRQITSFFEKLAIMATYSFGGIGAQDYLSTIISNIALSSAVHTNAFTLFRPTTKSILAVTNFYPLHDNASFTRVSSSHV